MEICLVMLAEDTAFRNGVAQRRMAHGKMPCEQELYASPRDRGVRARVTEGFFANWLLRRVQSLVNEQARDDLKQYYETRKTRDLAEATARLAHLDAFFTCKYITVSIRVGRALFLLKQDSSPGRLRLSSGRE